MSLAAKSVPHIASIAINELDVSATFNWHRRMWTTMWKWTGGYTAMPLTNKVTEYLVTEDIRSEYESELELWIANGWLVPYPKKELEPPRGLIPLMAIVQENKGKVRLVMDYWELNNCRCVYGQCRCLCSETAEMVTRDQCCHPRFEKSLFPSPPIPLALSDCYDKRAEILHPLTGIWF